MKILVLSLIVIFSSCGLDQQKIDPVSEVQSLSDAFGGESKVKVSFKFDDIDVDEPIPDGQIPIPGLGDVFAGIANGFARALVFISQNWDVDVDPVLFEVPYLDPEYIGGVYLKKIDLKIVPGSVERSRNPLVNFWREITFKRANLNFIRRIDISLTDNENSLKTDLTSLAMFDSSLKKPGCDGKCLSFIIKENENGPINLLPLFNEQGRIYILPKLEIKGAPSRKFRISGDIELEVVIKDFIAPKS